MFRYRFVLARLMVICLMLTVCGRSVPIPEGKTVVITPAIKGNSASMNVGDILEIRIPTIPKEGFEWITQDLDESILVQEGSAVYTKDTDPDSAGGIVTLLFKAVGAGQTNLNLLYVNSSISLSSDSFGMTVEVK